MLETGKKVGERGVYQKRASVLKNTFVPLFEPLNEA
jgi:hypothetical protein